MLKKLNLISVIGMLITFVLHSVFGAFQLMGAGDTALKTVARICLVFVVIHSVIGVISTVKTLYAIKKSGAGYFKQNKLFWARRISGFLIAVFLVFHLVIFFAAKSDAYRLNAFNALSLASQILLLISIALHVITNVKPVLISFGIKSLKPYAADIILVLCAILLVAAAAFIVYFLRWQAV